MKDGGPLDLQTLISSYDPQAYRSFIHGDLHFEDELPAISLFSGAGIGDLGFSRAGFIFRAQLEMNSKRTSVCKLNFPGSAVIEGSVEDRWTDLVDAYRSVEGGPPRLAFLGPPCQGLSTANHANGSSSRSQVPSNDDRNYLCFAAVPALKELKPEIVALENLPGFVMKLIRDPDTGDIRPLADAFASRFPEYVRRDHLVEFADHGVPQRRRRLLMLLLRRDSVWGRNIASNPRGGLPPPTHDRRPEDGLLPWPTSGDTLARYPELDSRAAETATDPADPFHTVPTYTILRYSWISAIPRGSGGTAYHNDTCPNCHKKEIPRDSATCTGCGAIMTVRPWIIGSGGEPRLIKGRHTSYRRMLTDLPVGTITTSNGHFGSDSKLHPRQNRVLSLREVLDHQSVPRDFRWYEEGQPMPKDLIRTATGDSVPPWFTFRLGLNMILVGQGLDFEST